MDLPALPYVSSAPTPSIANTGEPTTSPYSSQPMATETHTPGSATSPSVTDQQGDNHGYGFGPNAPSRYLLFPDRANMTAIELLTFLPNSVHCADFVHRFFTNGGSHPLLCEIVNEQRHLLVEWGKRGGRQAIYDTMRRAGHKGWGIKSCSTSEKKQSQTWNEASLDVGGYKTPGQLYKKQVVVENVPFRDLAIDVKQMPRDDDAIDLTRMVQHCLQNPLESWLYPRDWNALLDHLGGPGTIRHGHTDREAFERRTKVKSVQGGNVRRNLLLEAHERNKGIEKRKTDGCWSTPRQKRKLKALTPSPTAFSTSRTPMPEAQGQKKRRGRPNKAAEINKITENGYSGEEEIESQMQEYARSEQYVQPPDDAIMPLAEAYAEAVRPGNEDLYMAFLREGQVEEDDPYDAYAFGGPRHTPPYRWLYLIHQPDPADHSGWAENLRWVFVQNTLYRPPYRPDA